MQAAGNDKKEGPMAGKTDKVRYRVKQICFVGGNLIDPKGARDVFVWDAPGMEGAALELAPEVAAAPAPQSVSVHGGNDSPSAELQDAFARIDAIGKELDAKQAKILDLEAELGTVRGMLDGMQKENAELTESLATAERELAAIAAERAAQRLAAERAAQRLPDDGATTARPPKSR